MMNLIAIVEIDVFSLAILSLMFWNTYRKNMGSSVERKLFYALLLSNALLLVLDVGQWLLNGKPGEAFRTANLILSAVYFSCNPIPCVLWTLYAHYQIYRSASKSLKLLRPLFIPMLVIVILSWASCFNHWFFSIDAQNNYHRGQLFWLFAAMCISYLILTQLFIFKSYGRIANQFVISITVFPFPPLIGAVLQSIFFGLSLIWPCMTFSILVIFLSIQNSQLYRDHLTGLYNRRHLDSFLEDRLNSKNRETIPAGIMIDIDCFKSINDTCGHSVGDRALVDAGKILRMSVRNSDFICRYGGDEFIVILEIKRREELERVINRIQRNVERYNLEKRPPYKMSFSMGYDIYNSESGMSVPQFLCHIDDLMYRHKKQSKR